MNRLLLCHHKCASQWWSSMVLALAERCGVKTVATVNTGLHFDAPSFLEAARSSDLLYDANASARAVRALDDAGIQYWSVHLIRDPRDLLVSAYWSHLHSHPTDGWPALVAHRELLRSLSVEDGLRAEIIFSAFAIEALELPVWGKPFRYEDVVDHPAAALNDAGERFGWAPRWRDIDDIVAIHAFERLAGRPRGTEDVQHHYRRGVPGDWRRYFNDRVEAAFHARYPSLVERLGYEP